MVDFDAFAIFKRHFLRYSQCSFMGAFGGDTLKPLNIMSTDPEVEMLARPKPKKQKTLTTRGKNGSVNGKTSALSSSQAYPMGFGKAVAHVYKTIAKNSAIARCLPKWGKRL